MAIRKLYLLRHARAAVVGLGTTDYERPLSGRGRRAASAIGIYFGSVKEPPQLVLCSSARRAMETAMYLAAQITTTADIEVNYDRDLYLAAAEVLLGHIQAIRPECMGLLVVAHNPGIQNLALSLTQKSQRADKTYHEITGHFQTGAIASFTFESNSWKAITPGSGNLVDYVRP